MTHEEIEQQVKQYLQQGKKITELRPDERKIKNPNRGFSISYIGQQERTRYERERDRRVQS